ncbi:MAG: hypothetical protein V3U54_13065 [Thermodesulfobacteriota bacterium]
MPNLIPMIGKKFENLTVLERVPSNTNRIMYLCQCECNFAKKEMSMDKFRRWIKRIYNHWIKNPNSIPLYLQEEKKEKSIFDWFGVENANLS